MKDSTIYAKIVEVKDETVLLKCLIDPEQNYTEMRLFERYILDSVDLFPGNCIKIHLTSGPGWMQMDVHQVQTAEMHYVEKLLIENESEE
jgi:hypothetical protein